MPQSTVLRIRNIGVRSKYNRLICSSSADRLVSHIDTFAKGQLCLEQWYREEKGKPNLTQQEETQALIDGAMQGVKCTQNSPLMVLLYYNFVVGEDKGLSVKINADDIAAIVKAACGFADPSTIINIFEGVLGSKSRGKMRFSTLAYRRRKDNIGSYFNRIIEEIRPEVTTGGMCSTTYNLNIGMPLISGNYKNKDNAFNAAIVKPGPECEENEELLELATIKRRLEINKITNSMCFS